MTRQLHSLCLKLSLVAGLLFFSTLSSASQWKEWARHVGPAEKERDATLSKLKSLKNLDSILLEHIGTPDQGLALDVISALKKESLIPKLLEKIPKDSTGFLILTLSALLTNDNYQSVLKSYNSILASNPDLSAPNIVALLEPLGRMGQEVPKQILKKFLDHEYPEVRIAVLIYARQMLFSHKNSKYHFLFLRAKNDKTYQVRERIKSYMNEIPKLPDSIKSLISDRELIQIQISQPHFKKIGTDLRMFFGYKDSRPGRFVGDRHERLALIQGLLSSCSNEDPSHLACGFRRHPKDANLFLKILEKKNGKEKKVLLKVVSSSVSTDDEDNRKNPLQKILSNRAESSFLEALKDADMVFYNGHSRFGGGPDFQPPVLNVLGDVDSGFYKKYTTGTNKMMTALNKRNKIPDRQPLELLGIYSCTSSQHFRKMLQKTGIKKVITSHRLLHYEEALKNSVKDINQVLSQI